MNKCPWCGADADNEQGDFAVWKCSSYQQYGRQWQSDKCKISALTKEAESLKVENAGLLIRIAGLESALEMSGYFDE